MKENESRLNQSELTGKTNPSTLEGRGDIFMPEPAGAEITENTAVLDPEPEIVETPKPTLTPEELKRRWETAIGKPFDEMSAEERQAAGLAVNMGISPAGVTESRRPGRKFEDHGERVRQNEELFRDLSEALLENKDALESDIPDFDSMKKLTEFMDTHGDPTDQQSQIAGIADLLTRNEGVSIKTPTGEDQVINLSDTSRRILMEIFLEKIISIPDATPETNYNQRLSSFHVRANLDALLEVARKNMPKNIQYFGELVHIREVAHELNRNLDYGEQYKEYVTSHLRTGGLDFMQNDVTGVNTIIRLYEKLAASKVSDRKEWLNAGDIKAVQDEVRETLEQLSETGKLTDHGRKISEAERNRAFRIGTALFAGTQRFAMYASLGDLPPESILSGRIASVPYEYISRSLQPFKMIAPRFFSHGLSGSKKLMEMTFEQQEKYIEEHGQKLLPLFGLDKKTILMDTMGAVDLASHSWRSQLMYLGNTRVSTADGDFTLLEYLNRNIRLNGGDTDENVMGGGKVKEKEFSKTVEDVVLGQRLYLSSLTRFGSFDSELKKKLWQKVAILKPSTILALLPEVREGGADAVWNTLRQKLYTAEEIRVMEDWDKIKPDEHKEPAKALTADQMRSEKEGFEKALAIAGKNSWSDAEHSQMLEYMGMTGLDLTSEEKRLLQKLISDGIGKAGDLSKAKMPFAFAIDDAPITAWKKTGDGSAGLANEDALRLLLSDQKSITEGWGEINGLMESPTHGTAEHLAKAVESIGSVHGRNTAQDVMEPIILAWMEFASTHESHLWIPGLKALWRARKQPTSEAENHFRGSYLSLDEEDKANVLQSLHQVKAIRDNVVSQKEGMTQLDRLRLKAKASQGRVMINWIRTMAMLLGPAFAYEFFRSVVPPLK